MIEPALAWASRVEAPRCGVKTALGALRSGLPTGGSVWKTSAAAPANLADRKASTDEAEGLPEQFAAFELLLLPLAVLDRPIGLRQVAEEGNDVAEREFCDANRTGGRSVHDDDLPGGRFRDVDVVDADSRATHDLQVRRTGQDRLGDRRPTPDDQGVIFWNCAEKPL